MSPLTQAVVRGLNDKLYDKRKTAALEIERYCFRFLPDQPGPLVAHAECMFFFLADVQFCPSYLQYISSTCRQGIRNRS